MTTDLKEFMVDGGIIESIKRGDIAYYSKKDNTFLLRYDISTNNLGNYDTSPVTFDFKYITTFKETYSSNEALKLPLTQGVLDA